MVVRATFCTWSMTFSSHSLSMRASKVGIALLDGTFLSADELPGRSIAEVPHPTVGETMTRLAALSSRISFTHLNHTNPLLWDGRARRDLARRGFALAADGRVLSLEN